MPSHREINEMIKSHIFPVFYFKIESTIKIEELGYKWINMNKNIEEFYFECEK